MDDSIFNTVQQALFEHVVQPIAFAAGAGNLLEDAFEGTGWWLMGLLQIAIMLLVIAPLEKILPAQVVIDPHEKRVDVLYTLIHRLGFFKLAMFFTLDPVLTDALGAMRSWGMPTLHLDQWWGGSGDHAWFSFFIYLVVFDAVQYLVHRAQHQWEWWWALHSLHHSQQHMTQWSDNRNHLLDDVLRSVIFTCLALAIGVPPGQYVLLVVLAQLSENLQHANVRMGFGVIGERLWVSPRFHRLHHSIGLGHESGGVGTLGGCNFGVLLPWWDMACKTANFEWRFDPTGIRDQVDKKRDYGHGFWSQQWLGLLRLCGRT